MADTEMELIVAIISLISAIASPLITLAVSSRKRKLQVCFDHCDESKSTTFIIRNTGSLPIFIDEIWLHKTSQIEFDLFERFSRNASRPLVIKSGETIRAIFSESELSEFLDKAKQKGKVDSSRSGYKEYRLGFKIVISSSEGIGSTRWFKIGRKDGGYCRQYDFLGYHKTYYDLRRYYNSISWLKGVIVPIVLLSIGVLAYYENFPYYWIVLLAGYISLVVVSVIYVTDGLPNLKAVWIHIGILTIAFGIVMWVVAGIEATIVFSLIMLGYHHGIIKKYSGWDM